MRSKLSKVFRLILNPVIYRYFFHNLRTYYGIRQAPIVLCGAPRSGTSLLMSILDSHPEIHVIPFETAVLQFRSKKQRLFKNDRYHRSFSKLQLVCYLFSTRIKSSAKMYCEKTPLNILNVEEIVKLFGSQVRIINITRDGRDVVASKHPRLGYMVRPSLWAKCVQESMKFEGCPFFLSLRYEDLVSTPNVELNKIRKFLRLEVAFNHTDWLDRSSIKGTVISPVNNNIGFSTITTKLSVNSVGNWRQSTSPYVAEFISDNSLMKLNHDLGYD